MGQKSAMHPLDSRLAKLAARQHGVVALTQFADLGLSGSAIAKRARAGRLHRVHRGVYAVGHARLTQHGRYLAAVLSCEPGAVLSHGSAALLWRLPWRERASVDVTVPGSGGRRARKLIVVHRARLDPGESTTRHGIPVRSHLEERFLAFSRGHKLPAPEVNARIESWEVDFLWRDQRVIVEADGHAAHGTRAAFERDRVKDAELAAAGWRVVRITERRLLTQPQAVAKQLLGLLAAG
jgi:very-short-patch-repair endonuclease